MNKPIKVNIEELNRRTKDAMGEHNIVCDKLLSRIKARRDTLNSIHKSLTELEPELLYRYYHQSFKVFSFKEIIRRSKTSFEDLAPEGKPLNEWFLTIINYALEAEFDGETTNKNWLAETRPLLEALWHCKFFVEQMLSSADSLDRAPMTLPYDWAAVLHLYNLR
jgi:hypothetical protein